ncbi:TPA_asm: maturation protein [ssRNA phage Gephyllon.2_13]|uniref:Maturation protein n=2 Tax=Norzivirales TaxID=2842247 RepID=A0A8S5KYX4_9VIRU|nr:maturation protein [ssRNA phage Gephyllon.2_13]QDH90316.1 MAG: hypothetical protein H2BulkLitter12630_000001 [Leviviridae sp.]DAD50066.1 TPA_asm: maturation protein [ssRNA phage Gephyllon.2_13]
MVTKTVKIRSLVPLTTVTQFTGSAPTTTFQYPVFTGTTNRTSLGLKEYKTLIRNGQSATTDFTADRIQADSFVELQATCDVNDVGDPVGTIKRHYFAKGLPGLEASWIPTHLSVNSASAENKALTKLYSAIKSQQQQMSGFSFLGELRETIHGIRKPADALVTGLNRYFNSVQKYKKGIRHRTVAAKKRAIVDISTGLWLEASFGWLPLLQDVKGIAETLARFQYDKRHERVRGFGQDSDRSLSTGRTVVHVEISADYVTFKETKYTVIYRCGIRADDSLPPLGSINRLRELCGFNLQDFIPSLYQITPNSWLLDYFTNIGDIVEATCTSTANLSWINVSRIKETVEQTVYSPVWDKQANSGSRLVFFDSTPGRVIKSLKTVDRRKVAALDVPSLEFSFPGSANKYANLGAIFAGKSRKSLTA